LKNRNSIQQERPAVKSSTCARAQLCEAFSRFQVNFVSPRFTALDNLRAARHEALQHANRVAPSAVRAWGIVAARNDNLSSLGKGTPGRLSSSTFAQAQLCAAFCAFQVNSVSPRFATLDNLRAPSRRAD
jgi:hypothetical protein